MPINAAVFTDNTSYPYLEVSQIETPTINEDQVLIRARAFAANPADWKHKTYSLSKKGDVAGSDVAGVVEQIGSNVQHVKVGDYVASMVRGNASPTHGAFAEYVVAEERGTVVVPKNLVKDEPFVKDTPSGPLSSFEAMASVPAALVTVGLSFAYNLGLQPNGTILVWSGATSTGVIAIQIAKLVYGMKVIATASAKHHLFLTALGADAVFDYHDDDVVSQIKHYAKGSIGYALDTIATPDTLQQVYDATEGAESVVIDNLSVLDGSGLRRNSARDVRVVATIAYYAAGSFELNGQAFTASPELLEAFDHFWTELLPPVVPILRTNNLRVLPPGLASASDALDLLERNVISGQKVVFSV